MIQLTQAQHDELVAKAAAYDFLRAHPWQFRSGGWGPDGAGLPLDRVYIDTPEKLDEAVAMAIERKAAKR